MKKVSWIGEFKEFIARGNVLDMAVGVVVGSAFTAIVTSIVENLLTPAITAVIGLMTGNADLSALSFGPDGMFMIGNVISAVITFLITAFVVFWIVKIVNQLMPKKEEEPAPEAPAGPTQEELLAEIRDLLKAQQENQL